MAMSDLVFFNASDGYAEAMLRGFRKGILGEQQYAAIRNTTNLKDLKAVLMDTDYQEYIKDYDAQDTSSLECLLKKKLSDEIDYVQSVAGPDLQNFIEMIRHRYMIDNVINIVEGSKHKTQKDLIKSRSEPLGFLPEIEGLLNFDVKKIDELYEDVLIDTEVGEYFSKLLEEVLDASDVKDVSTIKNYLEDLKPEKVKDYLKKIWFEHFYHYCQTLNPTTRKIMEELLKFEADCQAIQIIYNSLAHDFNKFQEEERKKVIPKFGYLYPEVTSKMITADSYDSLKQTLQAYPEYSKLFKDIPDPKISEAFEIEKGAKTIDDLMFEEAIKRYSIAFEEQFHYACFYAYIKIKEQEVKNITYLADMISLDKDSSSKLRKNYILPFNY